MYHKFFGPIKIKTNWKSKSNNQSYRLSIRMTSNEQLSLVVNKQGLRSMKTAIKCSWDLEGQKLQKSELFFM